MFGESVSDFSQGNEIICGEWVGWPKSRLGEGVTKIRRYSFIVEMDVVLKCVRFLYHHHHYNYLQRWQGRS